MHGVRVSVTRLAATLCLLLAGAVVIVQKDGRAVAAPAPVPSAFTSIAPQRLVDTRIGLGAPMQRLQTASSLDVQVTGHLGIPSNATAVVANITAVDASGPGYLQVLPTGRAEFGSSSTLNIDAAGQTNPNATFAPLGDGGKLTVYAIFTTDVVIDIAGYFTPASTSTAGRLVPLTPSRILDTRIALGWTPPAPPPQPGPPTGPPTAPGNPGDTKNCTDFATWREAQDWFDTYFPYYGDIAKLDSNNDGVACESRPGGPNDHSNHFTDTVGAATVITLQVSGRGGVPTAGVSAVVMNVTAVDPVGPGFVQVAPTPVVAGASSNLNTAAGRTTANLVVVPLGPGGTVDLYLTTPADVLADVVGYFTDASAANSSGGLFVPITPDRQLDTRTTSSAPLPGGTVTTIDVSDVAPTAIAVAGNLTATAAQQVGYVQLAAPPISIGASSNVNVAYVGQTIANAVVSPVAAGQLQLFNQNPTHALLDVTGWFTSSVASQAPPGTPTTTTAVGSEAPVPTTTPPSTAPPVPVAPDGKIVFTRQNQIYTINPNGTGAIKLTSADKNYTPRWSPDGRRIAFVHQVGTAKNVWVMDADGSNKIQITFEGSDGGGDWSPDGQWLAYAGPAQSGALVLKRTRAVAPFGQPEQFPGGPAADTYVYGTPDWSVLGEIAFCSWGEGSNATFVESFDPVTEGFKRYINFDPSDGTFGPLPRFSSDGTLLTATVQDIDDEGAFYLPPIIRMYRVSDQQQVSSFDTIAEDEQLVFSPSGTKVAVMNDAGGAATIYLADANGSNRTVLAAGYQPDWQRTPV
jgi:hypothetical protein